MLGLGWPEVILILALLLLVFGPTQLPKIARDLGRAVREFQRASSGIMEELDKATSDSPKSTPPSSRRTFRPSLKTTDKPRGTKKPSETHRRSPSRAKSKSRRNEGLSEIAKRLAINTEGKTDEEVTQEVIRKIENGDKASNRTAAER